MPIKDTDLDQSSNNRLQSSFIKRKSSMKLTKMIICIGFSFLISNLSISLTHFMWLFLNNYHNIILISFIITNLSLCITHSSTIFIYYFFDPQFQRTINAFFRTQAALSVWHNSHLWLLFALFPQYIRHALI